MGELEQREEGPSSKHQAQNFLSSPPFARVLVPASVCDVRRRVTCSQMPTMQGRPERELLLFLDLLHVGAV